MNLTIRTVFFTFSGILILYLLFNFLTVKKHFGEDVSPLIDEVNRLCLILATVKIHHSTNQLNGLKLDKLKLDEQQQLDKLQSTLLLLQKTGATDFYIINGNYPTIYLKSQLTRDEHVTMIKTLKIVIDILNKLIVIRDKNSVSSSQENRRPSNQDHQIFPVTGSAIEKFAPVSFNRSKNESGITIFTENSYSGKSIELGPGKYGPEIAQKINIKSVQVSPNHAVTFYREPNFQPPKFRTTIDVPDLGAGDMRISSLIVSHV